MYKISVVIPCYNSYCFMDKCIKSLEGQTFKDFSVIFVDDCSTDETYMRLIEYGKSSKLDVTVVRNDDNKGPSFSRKVGVGLAQSEWICFCDSDDCLEVDFLESMLDKAEQVEADLALCRYNYILSGEKKDFSHLGLLSDNSTKEEFLAYGPMSMCCFIYRRYLLDGLAFPALYNAEDAALVPQIILKCKKIAVVDKCLYNYYIQREGSLSKNMSSRVYKSLLDSYGYIEKAISFEYRHACEFIGVKNICYGAVLTAMKAGIDTRLIDIFLEDFRRRYPDWKNNKFINTLPAYKKIFLFFVSKRMYRCVSILSNLHSMLLKFL